MTMTTEVKKEKAPSLKLETQKLQNEAKSLGFEVTVRHTRKMRGFAAIVNGQRDTHLSRAEFEDAVSNCNYETNVPYRLKPEYGQHVDSCGGFTTVTLSKDGKEVVGKHSFNDNPFHRAKGVVVALSKALRKVRS